MIKHLNKDVFFFPCINMLKKGKTPKSDQGSLAFSLSESYDLAVCFAYGKSFGENFG